MAAASGNDEGALWKWLFAPVRICLSYGGMTLLFDFIKFHERRFKKKRQN
jgi:hypothetical protein